MNLRDRLSDAPIIVVAFVMAILFGGINLLLNVAIGLTRLNWAAVISAVIGGLVFGSLMSLLIRFQRRRSGGVATARLVSVAIKEGKLPETASAEEWGPLLNRRRRQAKFYRWVGPVEFGLFALLGVYVLFADSARDLLWGLEIVFFVAAVIAYPIWANRQLAKIETLENQLSQRIATTT